MQELFLEPSGLVKVLKSGQSPQVRLEPSGLVTVLRFGQGP